MKNMFYSAILFSLLTACNSQTTTETTATPETATPAATETTTPVETTPADTTAKVDSTVAPAQ
ncbi:MAG: hypothetical protein SH857_17765 [Chitinophagales bacterium]|nr:hypothetical protein [Chitinophagales bacterium]